MSPAPGSTPTADPQDSSPHPGKDRSRRGVQQRRGRHNLGTVVRFEITRTLNKPRFWIAILTVPVVLTLIAALVSLSNSGSGTSAAAAAQARFTFAYTDASGLIDPALATTAGGTPTDNPAEALAQVRDGQLQAYIAYPQDPATQDVVIQAADAGVIGNSRYDTTATAVLQASVAERIGSPQLTDLAGGQVSTSLTTYDQGERSAGIGAVIPPLLYLVAFYLLILLLGNQMLNALLEEKENRVTEMVLTTIDPTDLISGKVIALFTVGVVQMLVFAAPTLVGYLVLHQHLAIPDLGLDGLALDPQRMVIGAVLLVCGFTLFTATLVALGAAMPTAKDAGPLFGVMTVLIFVPFYAVALVVTAPGAPIVQAFTYFPYTAPVTALLRNAVGNLPLWQAGLVTVELVVLTALVLRVAVQIFRYGSIAYTEKVNLRSALARRR